MSYRYFDLAEFDCSETGENNMKSEFLLSLDELRARCGFSFKVTSGFRSARHSIEAAKQTPGTHAQGIAADIAISNGAQRRAIIKHALDLGFGGIGVAKTFVHVDIRNAEPVVWAY